MRFWDTSALVPLLLEQAAARVWAGPTDRPEMVTYDPRLALAARLEGFRVLPGSPQRADGRRPGKDQAAGQVADTSAESPE